MTLFLSLLLTGVTAEADPNCLPIGRAGTVTVQPGQCVDLVHGAPAGISQIADAARGKPFLYVGEQHATKLHQQAEADLILALVHNGRKPAVGLEMITRVKQDALDSWSSGQLPESEFLERVDWKHQWGYDYSFYRPVFEAIRTERLPCVGLNVPRAWVHTVATSSFDKLPLEARLQLPPLLDLGNLQHRAVFDAMMGGHAMPGGGMAGLYGAQVLWDTAMADTALKFKAVRPPDSHNLMVIIAGAGHVMYGQGINYRVRRSKGGEGLTVVMISSDQPVTLSRGLADFVLVTPTAQKS